jgi:hypothetical protein
MQAREMERACNKPSAPLIVKLETGCTIQFNDLDQKEIFYAAIEVPSYRDRICVIKF